MTYFPKKILVLALLLLVPGAASAATITLAPSPAHVGVGDEIKVSVLLTSAIPTNAFSGSLTYSTALEPVSISDGNSIISLWITHPTVGAQGAPISFAGLTPGGFSGDKGILFSVVFRAKTSGDAKIALADPSVLRSDGAGTPESVTVKPLSLLVGKVSAGGYSEETDTAPPEFFVPVLGTDPDVFGGKNYLVFSTVDKGSGVDHYELAESRVPSILFGVFPPLWHTVAESPYELLDQNLTSSVYVKAVDRSGNVRLAVFPPKHLFTAYEIIVFLAILGGVVLLSRTTWGRRRNKLL